MSLLFSLIWSASFSLSNDLLLTNNFTPFHSSHPHRTRGVHWCPLYDKSIVTLYDNSIVYETLQPVLPHSECEMLWCWETNSLKSFIILKQYLKKYFPWHYWLHILEKDLFFFPSTSSMMTLRDCESLVSPVSILIFNLSHFLWSMLTRYMVWEIHLLFSSSVSCFCM
jgi:hypothetical protein